MIAIILLASLALVIGFQLYRVLGERTGHEQPILKPADHEKPEALVEPQIARPRAGPATLADSDDLAYLATAGPGVRALLAADPTFDVAHFLDGSRAAYRLILESFWKGDLGAMRAYVDDNVFETFEDAVEQRKRDGLTLDNRLVAIDQVVIAAADVERSIAHVTVRFETDIAAVTRNAAGEVIAGSLSDAVQSRDLWTFRRDISSKDPNWLLVETDDEE